MVNYRPPPENRGLYKIIWKRVVQPDRPQMTIQYGTEKIAICVLCNERASLLRIYYISAVNTQQCYHASIKQRSTECTSVARHSSQHNITQHSMLPQHTTCTTKLICDCF